jgi:hypothetical protein
MTTIPAPAAHPVRSRPDADPAVGLRTTVAGGLVGTGLAVAATFGIYAVGNIGAPIRVVTGWAPDGADLRVVEVVLTVVVAVAAGAVLLALVQSRFALAWRAWTITASLLAVASAVPLTRLNIDRGSKIALATMHLATGAAAIAGHAIARRTARRRECSTVPAAQALA